MVLLRNIFVTGLGLWISVFGVVLISTQPVAAQQLAVFGGDTASYKAAIAEIVKSPTDSDKIGSLTEGPQRNAMTILIGFLREYNKEIAKLSNHPDEIQLSCDRTTVALFVGYSQGTCAAFRFRKVSGAVEVEIVPVKIYEGIGGLILAGEGVVQSSIHPTVTVYGISSLDKIAGWYVSAHTTVVADMTWGLVKIDLNQFGRGYLDADPAVFGLGGIYAKVSRLKIPVDPSTNSVYQPIKFTLQ